MITEWKEFHRKSGKKTLVWKIRQINEKYETSHGQMGGQFQFFSDIPGDKGLVGSKSYMSPIENCTFCVSREIRQKEESGYVRVIDGKPITETITFIDFNKFLPKNFSSYKPQTSIKVEELAKLHKNGKAKYTRKYDGQQHLAVKHNWGWEIYSRRIELCTDKMSFLISKLDNLNFDVGTILVGELICSSPDGKDDFKAISRFCRSLPDEANNLLTSKFIPEPEYIIFDILYHNTVSLQDYSWKERRSILENNVCGIKLVDTVNVSPDTWESTAKNSQIEGYVVVDVDAKPGDKFFSFDGSAKRPKGSHKLKPVYTEEVVVYAGAEGSGKRIGKVGAVFVKQKRPDTNKFFNCGKVGSGFTDEDLDKLGEIFTKNNIPILSKDKDAELINLESNTGLVVEIEFSERQPGTNKFRFPVYLRVRDDKDESECYAQFLNDGDEEDE